MLIWLRLTHPGPAPACGFKVFSGHVQPSTAEQLRLLFAGGGGEAKQTLAAAIVAAANMNTSCRAGSSCQKRPVTAATAQLHPEIDSSVRVIVLERANVRPRCVCES